MARLITTVGVLGVGTMGAGIAQVAALRGFRVLLYDAVEAALARGRTRIATGMIRAAERGQVPAAAAEEALRRLEPIPSLAEFRDAHVVIEAAPEDFPLKRRLFAELDGLLEASIILASNTSSFSIAALAGATRRPERLVGMHFFNPAAVMPLVEVVAGHRTDPSIVEETLTLARRLGKTPVRTKDTPGFIVNRIARPFYLEAFRILDEGEASPDQIDRTVKAAGRFRMGPFELMDLIGIDVNLAVSRSVYEAFFSEPRFRPHPIQQRMVDAGLLGRKTGRGFYTYPDGSASSSRDQPAPTADDGRKANPMARNVLILGQSPLANALAELVAAAGLAVHRPPTWPSTREELDAIFTDESRRERYLRHLGEAYREADVLIETEASEWMDPELPEATLILTACLGHSGTEAAADIHARHRVVGFAAVPPLEKAQGVELAATPWTEPSAVEQAAAFFRDVGLEPMVVPDGPGLILPRILCLIVNEAAFALMEGVASAEDIDTAMKLGTNYPLGPLEWADRIGLDQVLAVLEGLQAEYGEDRYRPAPLLRRLVRTGHLGRATGRGFHAYD